MERSISVLETRVNALGVTEPIITQAGDTRIVVQLPGTTDPEQARQLVGSTALLEFRKVVKEGPARFDLHRGARRRSLNGL
jgi:preprotein translocase subunit SecD